MVPVNNNRQAHFSVCLAALLIFGVGVFFIFMGSGLGCCIIDWGKNFLICTDFKNLRQDHHPRHRSTPAALRPDFPDGNICSGAELVRFEFIVMDLGIVIADSI
jgi:hypothetical protein